MTNVAVVGAAGYAGIEAARLILSHDRLSLTLATSAADEGRLMSDVYPALAGLTELAFALPNPDSIASAADVALLAVLIRKGLLDAAELRVHLRETPMREAMILRSHRCLDQVREKAGLPPE